MHLKACMVAAALATNCCSLKEIGLPPHQIHGGIAVDDQSPGLSHRDADGVGERQIDLPADLQR